MSPKPRGAWSCGLPPTSALPGGASPALSCCPCCGVCPGQGLGLRLCITQKSSPSAHLLLPPESQHQGPWAGQGTAGSLSPFPTRAVGSDWGTGQAAPEPGLQCGQRDRGLQDRTPVLRPPFWAALCHWGGWVQGPSSADSLPQPGPAGGSSGDSPSPPWRNRCCCPHILQMRAQALGGCGSPPTRQVQGAAQAPAQPYSAPCPRGSIRAPQPGGLRLPVEGRGGCGAPSASLAHCSPSSGATAAHPRVSPGLLKGRKGTPVLHV